MFPNIDVFVIMESPQTQLTKMFCPVFVFHARDDSNVPFAHAEAFVAKIKAAGSDVTFETVPTGDHYTPMIEAGIPRAIAWIQKQQFLP